MMAGGSSRMKNGSRVQSRTTSGIRVELRDGPPQLVAFGTRDGFLMRSTWTVNAALSADLATIDVEDGARDVPGGGTGEERHGAGHVRRLAEAAERR